MFISLLVATFIVLCDYPARTKVGSLRLENSEGRKYWKPVNGTREEWLECRGLPCDEWRRLKSRVTRQLLFKDVLLSPVTMNDILLTESQVDGLERRMARSDGKPVKGKRATTRSAFQLLKNPIHYVFDGYHNDEQRQVIRDALQHWMDNTCVRFIEIPVHRIYDDHHIIFTREAQGCFSYTGQIDAIPQQINLDDHCLESFGRPVHEIGHVLGLWHEQQRTDRDEFVEVLDENIGVFKNQFTKHWEVPSEIPYELGSVMHYTPKSGSRNGETTLRARNHLYQRNMGQRTGLAFGDAQYINMVYCKDFCKERLQRPCERGGYQDPNSCHACKCPDGFSGDFCQDLEKPVNGVCGGLVELKAGGGEETIESPGYVEERRSYEPHTSCTWLIKVPVDHRIQIHFVDEFGLFCQEETCYHWVEVRYQRNIAREGPRFCCKSTPDITVTSESNEMMVVFRSNWTTTADNGSLRGFRAVVRAVPFVSTATRVESTTRSAVTFERNDSPEVTFERKDSPEVTFERKDSPAITSDSANSPWLISDVPNSPKVTSDLTDSPAVTSETANTFGASTSTDPRTVTNDSLILCVVTLRCENQRRCC